MRTKIIRQKRVNRSTAGTIGIWLFLLIFGTFMALPLVYALVSSLKPYEEIFVFPPKLYVINPTWDNFNDLFDLFSNSLMAFSRYVFNSLFITVACVVLHVLFSSMAAYPLAKNQFRGKKVIFTTVTVSLLFVSQVTFLPQYVIMAKLSLINTYGALIFPFVGASLGLFLMKQFMEQIPLAIIESARIDGASEYRIYAKIIMPNVKPAWLTLVIFTFQSVWNCTGQSLIFNEELKLLPTAISQITASNSITRMGMGMASTVFLMVPPILIFVFSQSRIIETMAYAGIKE